MNRELLTRLAIDRALGDMPPDTRQLLAEYLRTDPHSAEVVRSMEQTLALARHVLKDNLPSSLPALAVSGLLRIEKWHRRIRRMARVGVMAACLMIGLALGRLSAPTAAKSGEPSPVVVVKAIQEQGQAGGAEPGFWSIQRIRERTSQEVSGRSRPVIWHSPVATPRLGDPT